MSFLYPTFLFGLFSLSIPIIVHLFNFQKPRKVFFTNVHFLKSVQLQTQARLKLKHYLILISRLLFLLFLVLTFAQPILQGIHPDLLKGSKNVGIYLDNSLSMENQTGDQKAFDQAVQDISGINSIFSPSTNFLFLTNDFEGQDLFYRNKEKLSERISELGFSPLARSLSSVLDREKSVFDREDPNQKKNLFFFSDFQKSTFGSIKNLKIDSNNQYYFVPIQNHKISNLIIDSVWLEEPIIRLNENNVLKVKVSNLGNQETSQISLKLFIENVQVASASVSLGPASGTTASFSFSPTDTLPLRAFVRIEDQPIQFDNEYFFVINPSVKLEIYQIYSENSISLESLFSNEPIFKLDSDPEGQIDFSKLKSSNLVILNGLNAYSSGLIATCKEFVRKGGSLVIFPGDDPSLPDLTKMLGQPVNMYHADSTDKISFTLMSPDIKDPFFRDVFERNEKNWNLPYAFPVISGYSGSRLLVTKNGTPFLTVFSSLNGRVYLFSSPLEKEFTNFNDHSLFVPVMYNMAFKSYTENDNISYSLDHKTIVVKVSPDEKNVVFNLEGENFKAIPAQRFIDGQLFMEIPSEKMKAGFYILKGKTTRKTLAFNYGKEESRMEFYSPEELKKMFAGMKNVQILKTDSADAFIDSFKNENIGTPLWKYCLILSLIFLLTEILLIRFL